MPVASIVVCTHNRREYLPACLGTLLADSSSVDREFVVVDNASTDGTAEFMRGFIARSPSIPIRYVSEPRLGVANARNTGLRVAKGEFVVFTDDDVRVTDGWADAMVSPFKDPRTGAVAGRVVAEWPPDSPEWARASPHVIAPWDLGDESRVLQSPFNVVAAALALRRAAFEALGSEFFDPRLGHKGGMTIAYEEASAVEKVSRAWVVRFTADAVVHHPVPKERLNRRYLAWSSLQAGIGAARSNTTAHEWRLPIWKRAARLAVTATGAARLRLLRGRSADAESVQRELEAFHWTGRRLEYFLGGRCPGLVERIAAGRGGVARGRRHLAARA